MRACGEPERNGERDASTDCIIATILVVGVVGGFQLQQVDRGRRAQRQFGADAAFAGRVGHLLIDPASLGVAARANDHPRIAALSLSRRALSAAPTRARRMRRQLLRRRAPCGLRCAVLRTVICASLASMLSRSGSTDPGVVEHRSARCRTGLFLPPVRPSRRIALRPAASRAALLDDPARRPALRGRSRRRSCRSASAAGRLSARNHLFAAGHRADRLFDSSPLAAVAAPEGAARVVPARALAQAPARCTRPAAAAPRRARRELRSASRFDPVEAELSRLSRGLRHVPCSGAPYSDRGDSYNGTAPRW